MAPPGGDPPHDERLRHVQPAVARVPRGAAARRCQAGHARRLLAALRHRRARRAAGAAARALPRGGRALAVRRVPRAAVPRRRVARDRRRRHAAVHRARCPRLLAGRAPPAVRAAAREGVRQGVRLLRGDRGGHMRRGARRAHRRAVRAAAPPAARGAELARPRTRLWGRRRRRAARPRSDLGPPAVDARGGLPRRRVMWLARPSRPRRGRVARPADDARVLRARRARARRRHASGPAAQPVGERRVARPVVCALGRMDPRAAPAAAARRRRGWHILDQLGRLCAPLPRGGRVQGAPRRGGWLGCRRVDGSARASLDACGGGRGRALDSLRPRGGQDDTGRPRALSAQLARARRERQRPGRPEPCRVPRRAGRWPW
mmetsp:Transcript_25025/g.64604  ORF Transcript_25025/g.64604 Transcript_25025/m.64604 type:complete len:376 (-) Transcript_25025:755-1882(-)